MIIDPYQKKWEGMNRMVVRQDRLGRKHYLVYAGEEAIIKMAFDFVIE